MQAVQTSIRISLQNILVATDFEFCSEKALQYAAGLARHYGSRLLLAHVVPREPPLAMPVEPVPVWMSRKWEEAKEAMRRWQDCDWLQGLSHEEIVEHGDLWVALADIITRHGIDLVVIGTHAREGLKRMLLGSVAETIFRQAVCPVLTVGPHVEAQAAAEKMRHILFATDFSTGSLHALPYALSLAQENQAQLTLLHLVQAMPEVPPSYEESMFEDSCRRLHDMIPPDAELWCKPKVRVEYGFPVESIVKVAEEQGASLIVMGVHHAGAAATHLPWAIAHRVVCHAPCPVLTVRGD